MDNGLHESEIARTILSIIFCQHEVRCLAFGVSCSVLHVNDLMSKLANLSMIRNCTLICITIGDV